VKGVKATLSASGAYEWDPPFDFIRVKGEAVHWVGNVVTFLN
jgi:hypothetical protein